MEDIQQSELHFYGPLLIAYTLACALALILFRRLPVRSSDYSPEHPWKELLWSIGAVVGVLVIGQVYTAGHLIPARYNPWAWMANNLIIYSPVFVVVLLRGQSMSTLWLSNKHLAQKIGIGSVASFLAMLAFLLLRGEGDRFQPVLAKALSSSGLTNFIAVFLEGVALAFLFIRIRWVSNLAIALAIPSVLFALSHLPGMLADGAPWWHMVLMSLATGSIAVLVLFTCHRTRDIIWIGLVHYIMDAAISAY
jgi:hypothetical protein